MSQPDDYRATLAAGFAEEATARRGRPLADNLGGRWLNARHAAAVLGVARSSLYRAVAERRKVAGRVWRFVAVIV